MIDFLKGVGGILGDLARPYAIYAIATAEAAAILARADATVIGAGGFVLTALYAGRVVENSVAAHQDAKVKVAQAVAGQAQP